jgi:hypothetical protein
MGGAGPEFYCEYAAEGHSKFNVDLTGKFSVDNCELVTPADGHITTENTYFKCK